MWRTGNPSTILLISRWSLARRAATATSSSAKARVLPTAEIYGANAAGKSALLGAVDQLRNLVFEPRARGRRLPYDPHRLYGVGAPTVLGVEIVLDVPNATSQRDAIVY